MIGFYDYTVILTYMSLVSSISGMMFTVNGRYKTALVCLALSGLCDMFDGKVARSKKNRTEDQKNFGIQIDSLCDVVCFGAFPILLTYCMGLRGPVGILILAMYGVNGVIRLGYFNVMETKRQEETDEAGKYYKGLPITSISVILPIVCIMKGICHGYFELILHCTMLLVGMLFIMDFRMKKPKNITLAVLVVIVALALMKIFHVY
ncbi:MAG: CDP-diacylglycerol--serine O-phosphatidyltransferase [Clostridia bacterium]|nr:CDP-diacylglycerol--serine O-phosphatidyltransferase [Clostridia bacterium]NCC42578.1 CDP-diacylglycerol--serine O-phosphatidyltransferase [Clostridia bacterium]